MSTSQQFIHSERATQVRTWIKTQGWNTNCKELGGCAVVPAVPRRVGHPGFSRCRPCESASGCRRFPAACGHRWPTPSSHQPPLQQQQRQQQWQKRRQASGRARTRGGLPPHTNQTAWPGCLRPCSVRHPHMHAHSGARPGLRPAQPRPPHKPGPTPASGRCTHPTRHPCRPQTGRGTALRWRCWHPPRWWTSPRGRAAPPHPAWHLQHTHSAGAGRRRGASALASRLVNGSRGAASRRHLQTGHTRTRQRQRPCVRRQALRYGGAAVHPPVRYISTTLVPLASFLSTNTFLKASSEAVSAGTSDAAAGQQGVGRWVHVRTMSARSHVGRPQPGCPSQARRQAAHPARHVQPAARSPLLPQALAHLP